MKKSLPANAKIAKDAKETVQECVSEFISFITSEGMRRNYLSLRIYGSGDTLWGPRLGRRARSGPVLCNLDFCSPLGIPTEPPDDVRRGGPHPIPNPNP